MLQRHCPTIQSAFFILSIFVCERQYFRFRKHILLGRGLHRVPEATRWVSPRSNQQFDIADTIILIVGKLLEHTTICVDFNIFADIPIKRVRKPLAFAKRNDGVDHSWKLSFRGST